MQGLESVQVGDSLNFDYLGFLSSVKLAWKITIFRTIENLIFLDSTHQLDAEASWFGLFTPWLLEAWRVLRACWRFGLNL